MYTRTWTKFPLEILSAVDCVYMHPHRLSPKITIYGDYMALFFYAYAHLHIISIYISIHLMCLKVFDRLQMLFVQLYYIDKNHCVYFKIKYKKYYFQSRTVRLKEVL